MFLQYVRFYPTGLFVINRVDRQAVTDVVDQLVNQSAQFYVVDV